MFIWADLATVFMDFYSFSDRNICFACSMNSRLNLFFFFWYVIWKNVWSKIHQITLAEILTDHTHMIIHDDRENGRQSKRKWVEKKTFGCISYYHHNLRQMSDWVNFLSFRSTQISFNTYQKRRKKKPNTYKPNWKADELTSCTICQLSCYIFFRNRRNFIYAYFLDGAMSQWHQQSNVLQLKNKKKNETQMQQQFNFLKTV